MIKSIDDIIIIIGLFILKKKKTIYFKIITYHKKIKNLELGPTDRSCHACYEAFKKLAHNFRPVKICGDGYK